jgi:hypothetical protein
VREGDCNFDGGFGDIEAPDHQQKWSVRGGESGELSSRAILKSCIMIGVHTSVLIQGLSSRWPCWPTCLFTSVSAEACFVDVGYPNEAMMLAQQSIPPSI